MPKRCRSCNQPVKDHVEVCSDCMRHIEPRSYQHKDTPESFWERMRLIHGEDVGR